VIPLLKGEPWQQAMFTENVPVEIVLRLLHVFCDQPASEGGVDSAVGAVEALDLTIFQMLTVEAFRRGADCREIPWAARLEHVRLTGQPEGQSPHRPKAPDVS
jgi:hypothetical protein